ncbi:MAG: hypothetical protein H0V40_11355 [Actinobacteria bacterium]|nr:hypothetical protein [Actinomycetota bacterium]
MARAAGFPARVSTVRFRDELTLVLPGGLELRLGDGRYLALKLEVARRVKEQVAPDPKGGVPYIDTSVVARPVAGVESQVEGRG